MAASEGPAFIAETLGRLSSLEQQQLQQQQREQQQQLQQQQQADKIESLKAEVDQITANLDTVLNSKISAIFAAQGQQNKDRDSFQKWPILESKSVQNLGNISDSKSYRDWNRKLKNCIEQVRPKSRQVLAYLEQIKESEVLDYAKHHINPTIFGNIYDLYCARYQSGAPDIEPYVEEMNRDLWAILSDEASGEALDKIKSIPQGEGPWAYVKVHH